MAQQMPCYKQVFPEFAVAILCWETEIEPLGIEDGQWRSWSSDPWQFEASHGRCDSQVRKLYWRPSVRYDTSASCTRWGDVSYTHGGNGHDQRGQHDVGGYGRVRGTVLTSRPQRRTVSCIASDCVLAAVWEASCAQERRKKVRRNCFARLCRTQHWDVYSFCVELCKRLKVSTVMLMKKGNRARRRVQFHSRASLIWSSKQGNITSKSPTTLVYLFLPYISFSIPLLK